MLKSTQALVKFIRRFQSLLVLVLMATAISLLSDRFLTAANGWNIMRQISVNKLERVQDFLSSYYTISIPLFLESSCTKL